jgi:mRNA interferase MazF
VVERGEVWLVALDPTIGHEIKKTRPAIVVSPNDLNHAIGTMIVAPMRTGAVGMPFRVPLQFGGKKGYILAEQIRAVDAQRLVKRIGRIPNRALLELLGILREMFSE